MTEVKPLDDAAWRQLLLDARTHNGWSNQPVDDALLRRLYELARMGPTATNSQTVRLVFVKSLEAKKRLQPALAAGNVDKTMTAPVTAIVAYDTAFYDKMAKFVPHAPDAGRRIGGMDADNRRRMALLSATGRRWTRSQATCPVLRSLPRAYHDAPRGRSSVG